MSEELLLAVTADVPTTPVPRAEVLDGLTLIDALERTGLVKSRSEARRTIEQGGAYVNNVRQTDDRTLGRADLLHDRYVVLRLGRRDRCTSCGPREAGGSFRSLAWPSSPCPRRRWS